MPFDLHCKAITALFLIPHCRPPGSSCLSLLPNLYLCDTVCIHPQAKRKLELDAPLQFDAGGRFKTPSQVKTPSKKKPRPSPKTTPGLYFYFISDTIKGNELHVGHVQFWVFNMIYILIQTPLQTEIWFQRYEQIVEFLNNVKH